MRILVVGGGGREHAIVWRLTQNPTVDRIFAAPGNPGIAVDATCVPVEPDDVRGLLELVERESIDLTVVGPETPLVRGLVDELDAEGHRAFGPTSAAARIEGSKAWAKELCHKYGIPAARSRSFTDMEEAVAYLDELAPPYVIKADGLAAGKGVVIADDRTGAVAALRACLIERALGEAGAVVLIEEHLTGREISAFGLTDGREVVPLVLAQDYKRVDDGDSGPNTGGMGAYSPVPWVTEAVERRIWDDVLVRTVRAMESEGVRYAGMLYAGLMLTEEGPKVLEFNCRFGDPETQAIAPRLRSDLGEMLLASVEGNIGNYKALWTPDVCVTVVLASEGYPGPYETGFVIHGLDEAGAIDEVVIFHAGTAERRGRVVTAGGRVLAVSALGATAREARDRVYRACSRISFPGMHFRRDIGADVTEAG
jgi:phosphoribosylamine---glycine ligase